MTDADSRAGIARRLGTSTAAVSAEIQRRAEVKRLRAERRSKKLARR